MASAPTMLDPAINRQSDTAATLGETMLGTLETTALNTLDSVAQAGVRDVQGRMPYDPANPNYSSAVPQVRGTQGALAMPQISSGLILLLVIGYFIFRKKR